MHEAGVSVRRGQGGGPGELGRSCLLAGRPARDARVTPPCTIIVQAACRGAPGGTRWTRTTTS